MHSALRLHSFVALALLGALGQAIAAGPDAAWFDRCQPSDGAGQALNSGAFISFFNPLPRDSGALYVGITLPPRSEIRFNSLRFLAVSPGGDSPIELHPKLFTFKLDAVNDQTRMEFGSVGKLANTSPGEAKFALRLADNEKLPDQFTLVMPRIEAGNSPESTFAVHYRRFTPRGYVQVCGVNGATSVTRERPR